MQLALASIVPARHMVAVKARRRPGLAPVAVGLVGLAVFTGLGIVCRAVRDDNQDRLLQEQTDQAGAVLAVSVGQIRAPLDAAVRAAVASGGDPATFTALMTPLVAPGQYTQALLFRVGSSSPLASVGSGARLLSAAGRLDDLVARLGSQPFAIAAFLDGSRALGYAVGDQVPTPRFVVYAERNLSPDPNVRRRTEAPFADLEYAIYLGTSEDTDALLGASLRAVPLQGRRARTVVAFGDSHLLLVTTARRELGGALIGALWWIVLGAGLCLTAGAVVLLSRLNRSGARAGELARQNAALFRREHDIATVLQESFLPQRLVAPPGSAIAVRYWPATTATLVGGDFYDAFRIDERRWGILIGDVCGKGVEAAGLTGLVRHTVRGVAPYATSPSDALRAVHRAMSDIQPSTFCTACFLVYETSDAGDVITMALGGHPQPLLVRNGHVEPIGTHGTALGMVEPRLHDVSVRLSPGDTILLYTDGLTDARPGQAVDVDEIVRALGGSDGLDVERVADVIGELPRERRPNGSIDDTAVIVLRLRLDVYAAAPADAAPIEGALL